MRFYFLLNKISEKSLKYFLPECILFEHMQEIVSNFSELF